MRRGTFVGATLSLAFAHADSVAKLAAGSPFPNLEAETLTGTTVILPQAQTRKPFVAMLGFSRKSGDQIAQWSHALHSALPSTVAIYAVADLSHVPGLFRGFAVSGIRKQASPLHPEHDKYVLLMTKSNQWQDLVPQGDGDQAVVVAVDANATIVDIERLAYSEAAARRIATLFTRDDAAPK